MEILVVVVLLLALLAGIAIMWAGSQSGSNRQGASPTTLSGTATPTPWPPSVAASTLPPPPPLPQPVRVNANTSAALVQVRTNVARRRAEVEQALSRFDSLSFESLISLHYEAFTTADVAHAQYRTTLSSARSTSRAIEDLDKYLKQLDVGATRRDPRYLERQRLARATRAELVTTARTLQAQHEELLTGVQTLNAHTHTLKERIRTECGARGREWYQRLESRIRDG